MSDRILLGDEAVGQGAADAGITASYAYPGTPSTEITEFLQRSVNGGAGPRAEWCANEKTAYETALGVSLAGRRALVSMKHVGLNVAADPFINSALVPIHGGLVLAVADDPGMHSSQNEQDSRFYADFAGVPCLEPSSQQEAYDMTREAFDLSERLHLPVVLRLVTRLAHSRSVVRTLPERPQNALDKSGETDGWILLPAHARRRWLDLLGRQDHLRAYSDASPYNRFDQGAEEADVAVITTGIAGNYFAEVAPELPARPAHLHIGVYPPPLDKLHRVAGLGRPIVVLEEGYPFIERLLRGLVPTRLELGGKLSGELPRAGELNPDLVRAALGIECPPAPESVPGALPARPPQLCRGCPHADSYTAVKLALSSFDQALVTADIGCYTLGALPPYSAIESCVCMGASIGMARGAADAGFYPAIGVIGDSTFLHSGITSLLDAAAADTDMTVVILDNGTVGMTGAQPTLVPAQTLESIVLAVGVDPDHLRVVEAHPRKTDEIAEVLRREIAHHGLSVVIARRECIESAKKRKRAAR